VEKDESEEEQVKNMREVVNNKKMVLGMREDGGK
jgi:hypothetical protein